MKFILPLKLPFILLLLFLFSCSPRLSKHLKEVKPSQQRISNPYFADAEKDYVFKTKIQVFGKLFGGILIIKKLATAHHRIVFTTEFGNKIFDFDFKKEAFKVNFILADLNKKLLINVLKRDFQILIREESLIDKQYTSPEFLVYQTQKNKRYNFYYTSLQTGYLSKIVHSKIKEKIVIDFDAIDAQNAKKIGIQHKNIKLRIDLQAF